MDGAAHIVAQGIRQAGYSVSINPSSGHGPTVVATREDGRRLEATAASDLEAMVELGRRVLIEDLSRRGLRN